MAILILGKTACPLCGLVIENGQRTVSFPAFIGNCLDPLFLFNDAAFHEACFRQHPMAEAASMILQQMQAKTAPRNRRCCVCEELITDPDDYFTVGHLVTEKSHPLFPFNYAQFHRTCLPNWAQRDHVKGLLVELQRSGKWEGESLRWIIDGLSING